jgi:hypothetical protein
MEINSKDKDVIRSFSSIKYSSNSESEWACNPKKMNKSRFSYLLEEVFDDMSETEGYFKLSFRNKDTFEYNHVYKPYGLDYRSHIKLNGNRLSDKLYLSFIDEYVSIDGDFYMSGLLFYIDWKLGKFDLS